MSKASGDFIYFSGSDDILKPGSFKTMLDSFNQNNEIQFCTGDHIDVIDEKGIRKSKIIK